MNHSGMLITSASSATSGGPQAAEDSAARKEPPWRFSSSAKRRSVTSVSIDGVINTATVSKDADLPKEGSHFDLPIALALMAALGAVPADALQQYLVIGELNLDGTIAPVAGALPAAISANAMDKGLICPFESGPEAAWAGADIDILAPRSLIALANHFRGTQVLSRPRAGHPPHPGQSA